MRRVLGIEPLEKRTPPASLFGTLANFLNDAGDADIDVRRQLRSFRGHDAAERAPAKISSDRGFAPNKWADSNNDDCRWWRGHRRHHHEEKQFTKVNELFVKNFPDDLDNVIGNRTGRATLVRSDGEIELKLRTRGLAPGHAYTVWWVVFNDPSKCVDGCFLDEIGAAQDAATNRTPPPLAEVSVLYATSGIANARGKAVFRAELQEKEAPGQVLFGPMLTNAEGAEVHAVVRTHGLASGDPAVLNEQLTMFNGGCEDVPDQCVDIQVGVFRSPVAGNAT